MKGVVKEKAPPERSFIRNPPSSVPERVEVDDHVMSSLHAIVFLAQQAGWTERGNDHQCTVARHIRKGPGNCSSSVAICVDSFLKLAKPTIAGHKCANHGSI